MTGLYLVDENEDPEAKMARPLPPMDLAGLWGDCPRMSSDCTWLIPSLTLG